MYTHDALLKAKGKLVQVIILKVKFHLPEGPLPAKSLPNVVKKEENGANRNR